MKANAGLDVLGSEQGLSQATGAAMGDVEGGVTTALAKPKVAGGSTTGNKEVTAVDDFSDMPGISKTGNKEVTAVDDFSSTALAKPKASINYAGGDPDVDATATAAAPTTRVAAGTGAGGPANRYA